MRDQQYYLQYHRECLLRLAELAEPASESDTLRQQCQTAWLLAQSTTVILECHRLEHGC
jgi:hypothetical protein